MADWFGWVVVASPLVSAGLYLGQRRARRWYVKQLHERMHNRKMK